MKNNTIKYIFENRQPELRRLIVKYGLTPARSKADLWKKVNYLVTKFKQEMLFDIAKMHPDRDLILWAAQQQQKISQPQPVLPQMPSVSSFNQEENSNACGCSSANGDDYSNMNCGMSAFSGDDFSNCSGNPDCSCDCKKSNVEGETQTAKVEVKSTLANNMPLIVVGSLILVGGLIFLGSKA